jgi:hypothetical protein
MASKHVISCDRCGVELSPYHLCVTVSGQRSKPIIVALGNRTTSDLCEACAQAFEAFLMPALSVPKDVGPEVPFQDTEAR